MVHKDKVHIVLMLMVEADFLQAAFPQVQLNSHIQQLCAVIQFVRLCAMHVPVIAYKQSHGEYLCWHAPRSAVFYRRIESKSLLDSPVVAVVIAAWTSVVACASMDQMVPLIFELVL